ncbi:MAG: RDD family protein [Acidimicrobiales bacterium]
MNAIHTATPPASTNAGAPDLVKRRVTGIAIDMAILFMVFLVLRQVVSALAMSLGLVLLMAIALHGIVVGETGLSPGKALVGLKLVDQKGRPPGTALALIRLAAWLLDGVGLFGVLLIWFTPNHQRVGDTITHTFVVSTREEDTAAPRLVVPGPAPDRYSGGEAERQDFDPIWDGKVQAYVQWDPITKRWMQFSSEQDAWIPVEAD